MCYYVILIERVRQSDRSFQNDEKARPKNEHKRTHHGPQSLRCDRVRLFYRHNFYCGAESSTQTKRALHPRRLARLRSSAPLAPRDEWAHARWKSRRARGTRGHVYALPCGVRPAGVRHGSGTPHRSERKHRPRARGKCCDSGHERRYRRGSTRCRSHGRGDNGPGRDVGRRRHSYQTTVDLAKAAVVRLRLRCARYQSCSGKEATPCRNRGKAGSRTPSRGRGARCLGDGKGNEGRGGSRKGPPKPGQSCSGKRAIPCRNRGKAGSRAPSRGRGARCPCDRKARGGSEG